MTYKGYKRVRALPLIVFCNIVGRFIIVKITENGADSDRKLFTGTKIILFQRGA